MLQMVVNGSRERYSKFLLKYCFQAVAYALWHERNIRRVEEKVQPVSCLIARLENLVRNRITSLRRRNERRYEKAMDGEKIYYSSKRSKALCIES